MGDPLAKIPTGLVKMKLADFQRERGNRGIALTQSQNPEKMKSRAAIILHVRDHVTTTRFTEAERTAHAMADSTGFTVLEEDQLAEMSVDQTANGSAAGTRRRRM